MSPAEDFSPWPALAPGTQSTYKRDLERCVLPRLGSYRLGRLPAEEIESWLNDELDAGLAPSSVHRLWAQHDVAGDADQFTLHHPVVGDLRLHLERFDIDLMAEGP